MPDYHEAFPGKYLRAEDVTQPFVADIRHVGFEDVGQGADTKRKLVAYFNDHEAGLVLNKTRAEALAAITGSDDYDDWIDTRVRIVRGTTKFGGKTVNCVAIEPATVKAAPKAARRLKKGEPEAALEDVPF
jgi:hypothetical protein